ncbi:MAG TPA: hypothetical protein VEH06_02515 [Candidatus Bathyarchaeia archaeon]|nr:hypothetical protein [Candidatus Bathyarchaeia archaeon]
MDYKGKTTVLSAILVLIGMIFLVPAISEKVAATTDATASTLQAGKMQLTFLEKRTPYKDTCWRQEPTQKGDIVKWSTKPCGLLDKYEEGFVKYSSPSGDVTFYFYNPPKIGGNTCSVTTQNPALGGVCRITSGNAATVSYQIFFKSVPEINAFVRLQGSAAKLTYTLLGAQMNGGKFKVQPSQKGDQIAWTTQGFGDGSVKYGTGAGDVTFSFTSPHSYANTCKVTVQNPALRGTCGITTGPQRATAAYNLQPLK